MIKIGIVDLSDVLRGADRGKIKSVQSKFARILLGELFSEAYPNEKMPEILKGKYGKPYFAGEGKFFNITHEGGLAAVILSDEGEVGIDLQSLPSELRSREKIEERLTRVIRECDYYFTRAGVCEPCGIEIYSFLPLGDDAVTRSLPTQSIKVYDEPRALSSADGELVRQWSELEALMKLSGGGFADVGRIHEILATAKIKTLWVSDKDGKEYALCATTGATN